MFRNWGFLITEMVGLLLIAALLGLFVGWLIWARRRRDTHTELHSQDDARVAQLQAQLDNCRAKHTEKDVRIAQMEAEITNLAYRAENAENAESAVSHEAVPSPVVETVSAEGDMVDYDGDGVLEGENEGTRPEALSAPRSGKADNLKLIKGIGPKLEKLCNSLGFYHFDQISNWTSDEVAWVNANLEGFKGRVSRDNWVAQAKILASGGETEFSRRNDGRKS